MPDSPAAASEADRRRRFEVTALPFMREVYNAARRLTLDDDTAADLVQETYLRAFRTFDSFRPGTNCRAWLFTILYSVHINRWRKTKRELGPLPVDEIEERFSLWLHETGAEDPLADAAIWGPEWSQEVEAALRALPETFRSAVLLVDVHELSYEEAAATLDCPVGTVRSRLFRARRLLAATLQDHARRAGFLKRGEP
ncbi:MAG TPA: sigma-70 family RNA polymerase sigma factor [Gemmatimonadales bacterium]